MSALAVGRERTSSTDTTFFGHPRGLGLLFGVEMWERFSYYGMKALLVLYLVNAQHWSIARSASLYGTYTSLVYAAPLVGGALADRWLGTRRSLVLGGSVIALGHFALAMETAASFYAGLTLVVIGTGLFKPNVSTMVGQLYGPDDPRRDRGFTIFFMGINLGGFLAPLACGYLGQRVGWRYGFGAAGVGMCAGLALYLWGRGRYLPGIGLPPVRRAADAPPSAATRQATLAPGDGGRIAAVILVIVLTIPFWAAYEQWGSAVAIFADRHVSRVIGGFEVPASWFQSVSPLAIILGAPALAWVWGRLAARGAEPSAPAKMVIAFVLIAICFAVASVAGHLSETGLLVGAAWIIAADLFRTAAELCLSPVGLSYVSKTAPVRLAALLMGGWFLSEGLGNEVAGMLAAHAESVPAGRFFGEFVLISLGAGLVLAAVLPTLRRLAGPGPALIATPAA